MTSAKAAAEAMREACAKWHDEQERLALARGDHRAIHAHSANAIRSLPLPDSVAPAHDKARDYVPEGQELERAKREIQYLTDRYYPLLFALRDMPELPSTLVLHTLSTASKWPEDSERGKRIQRERGLEAIPPVSECESGAGFWERLRNAMLSTAPQQPAPSTAALVEAAHEVANAYAAYRGRGLIPDSGRYARVAASIEKLTALLAQEDKIK